MTSSEEFALGLDDFFGDQEIPACGPSECEPCAGDDHRRAVRQDRQANLLEVIETVHAGIGVLLKWLREAMDESGNSNHDR